MKKNILFSVLSLLLAAALIGSAAFTAGQELHFESAELPGGGQGLLFLLDREDGKAVSGVELLWDGAGELLRSAETALELARRGYGVFLVPADCAREGWDAMISDKRFYPRSMAVGCMNSGRSALVALWESTAEEEYAPRALLFLSSDVPVETEGAGNVLCLCPGDSTDVGSIDGYFAERTARRIVTLPGSARVRQRESLPCVIDWVGSSLGHPRDGLYADDEYLYPRCEALLFSGAALLLLSPVPLLLRRKGKGSPETA